MTNNPANFNLEINITHEFLKTYPNASVGILALENINNVKNNPNLDARIERIISDLKSQFPEKAKLKDHPIIEAYSRYYKTFKKSYHVLGQLESALFENRQLPSSSSLLLSMFAAELKNMLLTAIHDLDAIQPHVKIDISTRDEIYTTLRGENQRLKPGDMITRDGEGILSSVIYGPDNRTLVTLATSSAIFVVYAPEGIERGRIDQHFEDIKSLIESFSPQCKQLMREIYPTGLKR